MSSESPEYAAESRVGQILIGTIVPSSIASVFVLGRLYSRVFLIRNFGQDDAWILVSWLAGVALTIVNCTFVKYGYGHHHAMAPSVDDLIMSGKLSYAVRLMYQFVLGSTKLGLCAFYYRVFNDRRSRMHIYILAGFICAFAVPMLLYAIIQCRPAPDGGPAAICYGNTPDIYISAICNILADVLLLLFAIPRILPLKMPQRQKVALLGVVSLGGLVVVAAIVRLVFALQFNEGSDKTWDLSNITTWSAVEVDTGLFCASAPAIKPLIRKLTPGFLSSTIESGPNGTTLRQQRYTHRNTNRCSHGYQLESQTNLNTVVKAENEVKENDKIWAGDDAISSKAWRGNDESKGSHWDDSASEEAIVGGIFKTVSVTVTNSKA